MKKLVITLLALIALLPLSAQNTATFDDLGLSPSSYWNGSNQVGGFFDGHVFFHNSYDTAFGGSWSGFAYSNMNDTTTAGYSNQYSCAAGSGFNGSAAFGLAYTGSYDAIARMKGHALGKPVRGLYVTNSTYDYLSMKNGDAFAKKFGGATGMDPDWFRITIGGWYNGSMVPNTQQVYLADFRSSDSTQHYILKTWQFVDLSNLGNVDSLYFTLASTDTGAFGMNTPAYFCLDNLMTSDGMIAYNDSVAVNYHDSAFINILGNDTLNGNGPYSVALISGPMVPGASAYIDTANRLVYIPAIGIGTVDTVTYSVCDRSGACSSAYALIYVLGDTNTSITDIDAASLRLYPNPANGKITISSESVITHVSLIDMSGREVLAMDMDKQTAYINVEPLSKGLYTAVIHTTEGIAARRFVKE